MKEKILIRVNVPMADIAFDVRVPYDITAGVAAEMISGMFRSVVESELPLSAFPVLWYPKAGMILEGGRTVREYGITDSDMLLLI